MAGIARDGGSASFCQATSRWRPTPRPWSKTAVERYGPLDYAANNAAATAANNAAATPDTHPIAELDEDEWDRILAVDLKGVALCLKYDVARMPVQGDGGSIVNLVSVSSHRPQPNNAAYVAAKHGVIGLTKVASLERIPPAAGPRQHRLRWSDRHSHDSWRARDRRLD